MKFFWCAALTVSAVCAQNFSAGPALDAAIHHAIEEGRLPGAVLIVGHDGQVVYRKAYGNRALVPKLEAMTVDTIFDCASLTKVVATTPSLMKLFEEGKFRLNDKVTQYIPEFQGGKSDITIRNLLTHFSGPAAGPAAQAAVDRLPDTASSWPTPIKPAGPPGARFVYSDINFILLGELVHRLSGQLVSDYARQNIFQPLGMKDTMFQPPASLAPRIAPTERADQERTAAARRGARPHRALHGRSGRPRGPVLHRRRPGALRPDDAQRRRTGRRAPVQPADHRASSPSRRARPTSRSCAASAGTSIRRYSGNRGDLFPIGSYGHTGFTGTSIWIDPATKTYVILLANSVHPHSPAGHHAAARRGGHHRGRGARNRHAGRHASPATTRP